MVRLLLHLLTHTQCRHDRVRSARLSSWSCITQLLREGHAFVCWQAFPLMCDDDACTATMGRVKL